MDPSAPAWQPLTFGGVARFAQATFARLALFQFVTAVLFGAVAWWFAASGWIPVVDDAIARLPDDGAIRNGQLEWRKPSPAWLADGRFLSIIVDVTGDSALGQSSDLQVELTRSHLRVRSLFGYVTVPYPSGWAIALNQKEARPWWGAWRPFFLIGVGVIAGAGLWLSWVILGLFYMIPVKVIAFYTDREIGWCGAWRLAVAALLSPALLMAGVIFLYATFQLNLIGLLFAWLLHVVIGWIYVGIAPLRLPRLAAVPRRKSNPFRRSNKKSPFSR